MGQTSRSTAHHGGRSGFTLIELLVVVSIIAIISAILLPVFIRARDIARKKVAEQEMMPRPVRRQVAAARPALPSGVPPIIDSADLRMALTSSYHRIGMDVYTRYRVDCTGRITFRHPGDAGGSQVLLIVPFPDNTQEARNVQLTLLRNGRPEAQSPNNVIYDRTGIYYLASLPRGEPLTANVNFTALGREQFDYDLPPARQLRSVTITLGLRGVSSYTIPDEALQPSTADPQQLRWEFKNLVSDRRISVLIPGAEAPLARVLLLLRLVGLAVLLFGAGFWYLSEQVQPGQLDKFRWGHFLLLALTYSLFFVIFTVLEFHGTLPTPLSMAVSAVFSLPLLVLHVSRVLNLRFAITSVLPLTIFTLGMVLNGVYGGALRDYVFIGATVFVIGYVTVNYQSWAAGRERRRLESEAAYTNRRRELIERVTTELGAQMAELSGADAQAGELLKSEPQGALAEELAPARSRLARAREPVSELHKAHQDLENRLTHIPVQPDWEPTETFNRLEREAAAFRSRIEPHVTRLQTELAAYRQALKSVATPAREGQLHCVACGQPVPDAPFCQQCGCVHPIIATCAGCGERITIPVHLLAEGRQDTALFCSRCGTRVPTLLARADTSDAEADVASTEGE
ncbi:MAG TPA: prepilin-type N-terminal cleavage/methylation domain-containing protein [Abditibacteriaceae bacterium]|nr:prepilin-type N-terminal cleavage/methylation domain-containing protein [Abditibacteriaceae bacterium]